MGQDESSEAAPHKAEDEEQRTNASASASATPTEPTKPAPEPRRRPLPPPAEPDNLADLVPAERLAAMSDKERYSMRWAGHCRYVAGYVPAPPAPPVPAFPCDTPGCTEDNRVCEAHRMVLFVKRLDGTTITIPYGSWQCWGWYKQRIEEVTGIPIGQQRLIFAGCQREDHHRHSGLQYQSTIHLVLREEGGG